MGVADEDLRHGAAAGELHHRRALGRVQVDADFVDRIDPALLQQRLGAHAIRADRVVYILTAACSGVSSRLSFQAAFRPADWHRARPPARRPARASSRSPASAGSPTARADLVPGLAQHHQRQRLVLRQVVRFFQCRQRHALGAHRVAGCANSAGSLHVDQHGLLAIDQPHRLGGIDLAAPPALRWISGHSSRPPERWRRETATSCRRMNFT